MQFLRQLTYDLGSRPFLVIWEATQACDLACRHCRAEASPNHHPDSLSTAEAKALIDQVEAFGHPRPLFIITGGDPFKRSDLFELVAYAADKGLHCAASPSGTPLLNQANLSRLHDAGARAISLSLDSASAAIHDEFRGVPGSYALTLAGWRAAQEVGLKIQINSTITRYNLADLPRLFALVRELGAMTWSVFFLVPMGRAQQEDQISAAEAEAVMSFLYDASKFIAIKTTEGHQYKRVVQQRSVLEQRGLPAGDYLNLDGTYDALSAGLAEVTRSEALPPPADHIRRKPLHVNAGDGFVFISHRGDVCPSGYFPLSAGNVRQTPLGELYRDSALFRSLRDQTQLKGRCGACEYRTTCGGSRSRAYATTRDYLAEDGLCLYQPGSFPFPPAPEAAGD